MKILITDKIQKESLKIFDENGIGLSDAKVELLVDESVIKTVHTDSNGYYSFEGLGYGNYSIRVNASGYYDYKTSEMFTVDKDNLNVTVTDITLNAVPISPTQIDLSWLLFLLVAILIAIIIITLFLWKRKKRNKDKELTESEELKTEE